MVGYALRLVKCIEYFHAIDESVSAQGIQVDERKVQAIRDWPVPQTIQQVRSFHGLASFYWHFVNNFSTLVAPITEITKLRQFVSNPQAQAAFEEPKKQLSSTHVLALPCFDEVFEVECDASGVGIGAVLSQLSRLIAYFNEKLNDTKRRYTTYDKEFYAIVRALDHWANTSYNLGMLNAWSTYKPLLSLLSTPEVMGLELLKHDYSFDPDFGELFSSCQNHATGKYHLSNGFLLRGQRYHGLAHAYKVSLLGTPKEAATLNVANIEPYYDPVDPIPSLRANFSEAEEDDRQSPKDPSDMIDLNPPPIPSHIRNTWVSLIQSNPSIT
ncbi:RNA-directed DNA polymerase [Tanacetum coccineum]